MTDRLQQALNWYGELDRLERYSVDKKINRIINHIKSRSVTQFSKNMGVELIYALLRVL